VGKKFMGMRFETADFADYTDLKTITLAIKRQRVLKKFCRDSEETEMMGNWMN
jgi:hypothetical protein